MARSYVAPADRVQARARARVWRPRYQGHHGLAVATDICQYCGVVLDAVPPRLEQGWAYGIACSACPPGQRRTLLLARGERVAALTCPDCGARLAPAEEHPDVLVVKELTYEVCAACGERCGVAAVRMLRDVSGGLR